MHDSMTDPFIANSSMCGVYNIIFFLHKEPGINTMASSITYNQRNMLEQIPWQTNNINMSVETYHIVVLVAHTQILGKRRALVPPMQKGMKVNLIIMATITKSA